MRHNWMKSKHWIRWFIRELGLIVLCGSPCRIGVSNKGNQNLRNYNEIREET